MDPQHVDHHTDAVRNKLSELRDEHRQEQVRRNPVPEHARQATRVTVHFRNTAATRRPRSTRKPRRRTARGRR